MDANTLRRINWLWKHRHTHDGDTTQQQINIIRTQVESQADTVSYSATGAFAHLLRSTEQEIDAGGEAVEWSSAFAVLSSLEFDTTVPVTDVPIPKDGYYDIHVEFDWVDWTAGGIVQIVRVRNGATSTVWPSPAGVNWQSAHSQEFSGTAKGIPFLTGDAVRVVVDHGDSSTQALGSALLSIELVDRTPPAMAPPDPTEQIFVFTESGTFDWESAGSPDTVDVWIVAGGGGGGSSDGEASWRGGGGGAGGVLILDDYAVEGDCTVVVGAGGLAEDNSFAGGDGGNSSFDGQTAIGGGGGGGKDGLSGRDGGSGGGSSSTSQPGGSGVVGQGNDGGGGDSSGGGRAGGGGGGYSQAGQNASASGDGLGGDGGSGVDLSAIVGTDYGEDGWFAGGGGGGAASGTTGGDGGRGGGGRGGDPGFDALPNSGGGGGGARQAGAAGNGGSGIVIVRVII